MGIIVKGGVIMVKLSSSEIYIMNIIWEKGEATSFDILDRIKITKRLSENTVRTLLARMVKKGAISIKEKIIKTYTYMPQINKDEFQIEKSKEFLDDIYNGDIKSMLLNYLKLNKIQAEDLEDILKIIKDKDIK